MCSSEKRPKMAASLMVPRLEGMAKSAMIQCLHSRLCTTYEQKKFYKYMLINKSHLSLMLRHLYALELQSYVYGWILKTGFLSKKELPKIPRRKYVYKNTYKTLGKQKDLKLDEATLTAIWRLSGQLILHKLYLNAGYPSVDFKFLDKNAEMFKYTHSFDFPFHNPALEKLVIYAAENLRELECSFKMLQCNELPELTLNKLAIPIAYDLSGTNDLQLIFRHDIKHLIVDVLSVEFLSRFQIFNCLSDKHIVHRNIEHLTLIVPYGTGPTTNVLPIIQKFHEHFPKLKKLALQLDVWRENDTMQRLKAHLLDANNEINKLKEETRNFLTHFHIDFNANIQIPKETLHPGWQDGLNTIPVLKNANFNYSPSSNVQHIKLHNEGENFILDFEVKLHEGSVGTSFYRR